MQRLKRKALALAVLSLMGGAHLAQAATSQPIPIEAEDRAKLARVKARGNAASRIAPKGKSSGDDADECSIDIGNVDTGGRGRGPREVNIFIPGDIFQVNNRCR